MKWMRGLRSKKVEVPKKNLVNLLVISFILNVAFGVAIFNVFLDKLRWESEAVGMAAIAGDRMADADFLQGDRRYLEAVEGESFQKTDRVKDGLDVWIWPWSATMQPASQRLAERFAESYNLSMRQHVEKIEEGAENLADPG